MPRARLGRVCGWCVVQMAVFSCSAGGLNSAARAEGSHAPDAARAAAPGPLTTAASVTGPPKGDALVVDSFDCFKVDGDSPAGGTTTGPGIAAWNGGGPGGASWNTFELLCAASIRSTCLEGTVTTDLRVGSALLSATSTPLRNGKVEWRLRLRSKQWEKGLDEVTRSTRVPYRTALFRIAASLTCRAPYELRPGIGPRSEFTADRMFVAGFGRGE